VASIIALVNKHLAKKGRSDGVPAACAKPGRANWGIREKGIYKEERFIHSPQASHITVEFPSGAELKEVINLCAKQLSRLSSHPEVIAAAHKALDERGYGMFERRFICGTQDVHRRSSRS